MAVPSHLHTCVLCEAACGIVVETLEGLLRGTDGFPDGVADGAAVPGGHLLVGDRDAAVPGDPAGIREDAADERVEQGGFPAAVLADYEDPVARGQRQGQMSEDLSGAERHGDVVGHQLGTMACRKRGIHGGAFCTGLWGTGRCAPTDRQPPVESGAGGCTRGSYRKYRCMTLSLLEREAGTVG